MPPTTPKDANMDDVEYSYEIMFMAEILKLLCKTTTDSNYISLIFSIKKAS